MPGGEYLVETLDKLGIDMNKERTADLGRVLKRVYKGQIPVSFSLLHARDEINAMFESSEGVVVEKAAYGRSSPNSNNFGDCPLCGKKVVKSKTGNFGCSGWKQGCKFVVRGTVCGKKLTDTQVKTLVSKGRSGLIKGFKSKSGRSFDAHLVLTDEGKVKFEF